jgi:hypothetical protein
MAQNSPAWVKGLLDIKARVQVYKGITVGEKTKGVKATCLKIARPVEFSGMKRAHW